MRRIGIGVALLVEACGGIVTTDPSGSGGAHSSEGAPGSGSVVGPGQAPSDAGVREATGPSCDEPLDCGGTNCCEARLVPSGTFFLGRSVAGSDACPLVGEECTGDEVPELETELSPFFLDTFEVTVGRFRRFFDQYDGRGPEAGAGAHPHISGSGWDEAWNAELPPSRDALEESLRCSDTFQTWTSQAEAGERDPMNCLTWHVAFAFCIWDGGRLPTEAEWEHAAAGGDEERLYAWGNEPPSVELASFGYDFDGRDGMSRGDLPPVGSTPGGAGRWFHQDLTGSLWEWTLDWYLYDWYGRGRCQNCANLSVETSRVYRGGGFVSQPEVIRVTNRFDARPEYHWYFLGVRCARDVI